MWRSVFYALESIAAGFFLWLGLYLVTRDVTSRDESPLERSGASWWQQPGLLTGFAMILASAYIFGAALETAQIATSEHFFWRAATWWTAPMAIAFWFNAVVILVYPTQTVPGYRLWRDILGPGLVAVALILAVTGTITEFLFRQNEAAYVANSPVRYFYLPPRSPSYLLYGAFALGTLWTCVFLLYRGRHRQTERGRKSMFTWLTVGASLIAFGVTISIIGYGASPQYFPTQIGDIVDAFGLIAIGRGVVRYGALLENRTFRHDLMRSLARVWITVTLFILIYFGLNKAMNYSTSPIALPLLIVLIVTSHTPTELLRRLLDDLTLPASEKQVRQRLRTYERRILTAIDVPLELEQIEREIPDALRTARDEAVQDLKPKILDEINTLFYHNRFKTLQISGPSVLLDLNVVHQALLEYAQSRGKTDEELTEDERGIVLQAFLKDFIGDNFYPDMDAHFFELQEPERRQWIENQILYNRYILNMKRADIADKIRKQGGLQLPTSGDVYTQHFKSARERLALLLWEAEMETRGSPHTSET